MNITKNYHYKNLIQALTIAAICSYAVFKESDHSVSVYLFISMMISSLLFPLSKALLMEFVSKAFPSHFWTRDPARPALFYSGSISFLYLLTFALAMPIGLIYFIAFFFKRKIYKSKPLPVNIKNRLHRIRSW